MILVFGTVFLNVDRVHSAHVQRETNTVKEPVKWSIFLPKTWFQVPKKTTETCYSVVIEYSDNATPNLKKQYTVKYGSDLARASQDVLEVFKQIKEQMAAGNQEMLDRIFEDVVLRS